MCLNQADHVFKPGVVVVVAVVVAAAQCPWRPWRPASGVLGVPGPLPRNLPEFRLTGPKIF